MSSSRLAVHFYLNTLNSLGQLHRALDTEEGQMPLELQGYIKKMKNGRVPNTTLYR